MKYSLPLCFFMHICFCLLFTQGLYAQEDLFLLKRLDKGLPANGLNGSKLGEEVAFVGDLNGDGYDDWAAGLPWAADYETGDNRGKVYLYFGGPSLQSNQVPNIILSMNGQSYNFGDDIFPAGDVNGDGYDDMIIRTSGSMLLYYGGNPMDPTPDHTYNGYSTKGIGDINKDGFDDLAVSTSSDVEIFMGGITIKNEPDIVFTKKYGTAGGGDINKDGFSDILIGDPYFNLSTGRVFVYYGGVQTDTIPDIILHGEHENDRFGNTVSVVDDINKDGYNELLVSADTYHTTSIYSGKTFIYYGGNPIDTIADLWIEGGGGRDGQSAGDVNKDGYNDLLVNQSIYFGGSPMNNTADIISVEYPRVAVAGDINGDGYSDIIKGYPDDYTVGEGSGRIDVFYGAQQVKTTPDLTFYGAPGDEGFGTSVSAGGDVNNDGYNDFIISAPGSDTKFPGTVSVYFGGPVIKDQPDIQLPGKGGIIAGDINGDGTADMVVSNSTAGEVNVYLGETTINTVPDITLKPRFLGMKFQGVVPVGDINGDGFDDIAISDSHNSLKDTYVGRVYIYFGGLTIHTDPDLILEGEEKFNYFGGSITGADLNKDGFSDLIIGAYGYERTNLLGRVYVYYGSATPDTTADLIMNGQHKYQRIGAILAPAGDVNGDGYADFMAGMPYNGNSAFGISYVNIYYGGAKMDTIPDVVIEKNTFGLGSSLSSIGDFNNDGYDDIIVDGNENHGRDDASIYYGGKNMDTDADMVITGEGQFYGPYPSLAFAGDVNKDGHSDLLLGYYYSSAVGAGMGRAYLYSSKMINTGVIGIEESNNNTVYPNPFNTQTTIRYHLQRQGKVLVRIFNTSGQQLETLVSAIQPAGDYTCTWQPKELPNGVYFCRIETSDATKTIKVILKK